MLKTAVILAGGKGTRLQGIRGDIPKPMMPLAGKPILHYLIDLCKEYKINDIWITVNHLKDSIIQYFGDGSKFGVNIQYFVEDTPLGTVGGVKALENEIDSDFLVLYGDVLVDMDLNRLWKFHLEHASQATLVVHPNDHPHDSDLLEMDEEGKVIAFFPKPHPKDLWMHNQVNAATYIFNPTIFNFLEADRPTDFGKDVFPKLVGKLPMFAYSTPEYLKDMGTPDRLERVEKDILSGKVARRNLKNQQKAIFLDRDGVINYDTDLIHRPEDFQLFPWASEAIRQINKSEYICSLATNQSVIARGLTDLDGLNEIHRKMETELGESGAFLDGIYYCPHHPHGGFEGERPEFKIDCDCRKPKPGMLLKAAKRFNIDLSISWMIGDSERDVMAGRNAGVTTIGLRSGHGLRPSKAFPDFMFDRLDEAVSFILNEPYATIFDQLKSSIQHIEKPFIGIAGNTRSGKSTLAADLARRFKLEGKRVLIVSLDQWIRSKQDRQGDGVFMNFNMPAIEKALNSLKLGETVTAPGYAHHERWSIEPITYNPSKADVVIVEGVVALSSKNLRKHLDIKIFKEINRDDLRLRFEHFYRWKGMDDESLDELFNKRLENEYEIIEQDAKFADVRISS